MRLLDLWIGSPACVALGWTLFHSLWEGAIVAAALGALLAALRSPRVRYAAACLALLVMLTAFAATLAHLLPEAGGGAGTFAKLPLSPWVGSAHASAGDGKVALDAVVSELVPWLAPLWLAGVCLFYLRYAAAWLWLYRLRRRGVCSAPASWQNAAARLAAELKLSRPVVLLESLFTDTPVILGHARPVIFVPLGFLAGLPPEHIEAILLHELAHIRRADYLVNVCQRAIEGLLFYHPAVWWISHVIRTERENCCDDMVVALRGDAHSYAVALTALEQNRLEQNWPNREPALAATGGNLMKRIQRLLYPKGPSGIWAPALAAVVLIASAALALGAWQANSNPERLASTQADKAPAGPWQKWLNEDVVYIIAYDEALAFQRLKTDEEREHFIEQFWERRNPTPGSAENRFKEEHYRRIAYANNHFASKLKAGWQTDRGTTYIKYGPPDEIDSHPTGGTNHRPESEGGGTGGAINAYPFEQWRYRHIEGIGTNVSIDFIDPTKSGEFRMTSDPNNKKP
jgi:GWxTD domain-containing protein